ncbi:major tail protein [Companilactobacillus kedongensis]|uniref:major tail protein n=1 Tax=Companilactobacillus kedongensis TaxID=2486004 RepID=UPI001CDB9050|nr:major tail protein [Companilactobacillus kedongensis]
MAVKDLKAIGSMGFRRIFIGIMDDNENVIKVVTIDESSGGTIELKTSGFSGQLNVEYASNIAYFVSDAGTGTGKVELSMMELPSDVSTEVLGDDVDENGIYMTTSDVKQPYVAIIAEAQDLNQKPMWIGIAKAKFATTDGNDLKTGEDKGMTPEKPSITGSAITRRLGKLVKTKASNSNGTTLAQFAKVMFPGFTGDLDSSTQVIADEGHKTDGSTTNEGATA